jgi:uncharacterized iron-regulated protein
MPYTIVLASFLLQAGAPQPATVPQPAAATTPPATASVPRPATADYVPQRVFDTRRGAFIDFETMVAALTRADVVFVGEQHDDPNTHRLELALVSGLRRRRVAPTISMEMFERDVQEVINRYLSGAITEPELLKDSRPWPRYASDYRELIEMARAEGWSVIAANVPRRFASDIAKGGEPSIGRLSAGDRELVARDLQCPHDAYFERFTSAMTDHTPGEAGKPAAPTEEQRATTDRYYWAQCSKDETMAESIARAIDVRAGKPGPVVHFTGAFHSDFGGGTAERTRRRLAGRTVVIVSMLPVKDLDVLSPGGDDLKRADFLVYTVK